MTRFLPVDTTPAFPPRETGPDAERLIEGDPWFKTWEQDASNSGPDGWRLMRTGVWEATPGTTRSIKGETFEFCHILEGRVEIAEQDGTARVFDPGESFVLKPGFVGTWKTLETVRKIFVIAS